LNPPLVKAQGVGWIEPLAKPTVFRRDMMGIAALHHPTS
jgi:hypothetical protein